MLISYCDAHYNFRELELPPGGGIFGYDPKCFVVLDETGISGLHFRLSESGGHLFVEDLQSLNGTFLNKEPVSEKTEIRPGDSVAAGMVVLRFEQNLDSWTVTLVRQSSARFVVEPVLTSGENARAFATAVTVVASKDIRQALDEGNFQQLEKQMPAAVPSAVDFSFDALEELGKYRIIKKIGKGGMGVVFLARHKVMNTYRALKVLPHSIKEENSDFFERFMREARIASEIRHPNIVGVMDAETDLEKGVSYIVMEFIDGGTLRRILKLQRRLPEVQALLIVKAVAEALKGIWENRIVHRDIKPDNIMFTRQGEVKLADLGIAKNEEEDVSITQNDMMIGTPAYLSQEQIESPQNADIRSDIYSLGVTFYEMLTGETPYTGKNTYSILQKMVSDPIPDPRKKNGEISPITARIVMKMLQKRPEKRYQTPQELLKVLNEVLQGYSVSDIQKIIKSAVLNTSFPADMKQRIDTGFGTILTFLIFAGLQDIGRYFSFFKGKRPPAGKAVVAFQISPGGGRDKTVDISLNGKNGQKFKLMQTKGRSEILEISSGGKVELKGLPAGSYQIYLHKND